MSFGIWKWLNLSTPPKINGCRRAPTTGPPPQCHHHLFWKFKKKLHHVYSSLNLIKCDAIRVEDLLVEKVEIWLLNAVLLFSKTVYWEDAGSKIQFSLISVLKNWDIWPQSRVVQICSCRLKLINWWQAQNFLII